MGCAEPLAWLCPDEGGAEVRPEAGVVRLAGRVGVFGWLAREGWKEGGKRSANQKPNPLRWGAVGLAGVFGLGSLRWLKGWKRSSPKAQP